MTQVLTERLTKRAQQLDDVQAEKALAFIEFLLAQERIEKERYEWHRASEEAFARVWDNEHDAIYDNWRELYGVSNKSSLFYCTNMNLSSTGVMKIRSLSSKARLHGSWENARNGANERQEGDSFVD